MRSTLLASLSRLFAAGMIAGSSDAWAQRTPQPPPVRMPTGLPLHTGWFLGLLVCALLEGVAWFVLCRGRPPPPSCSG